MPMAGYDAPASLTLRYRCRLVFPLLIKSDVYDGRVRHRTLLPKLGDRTEACEMRATPIKNTSEEKLTALSDRPW